MTTTARKIKATPTRPKNKSLGSRKTAAPKRLPRIRPELLPDTAVYGTFADREYIMIPVEDFGEWYEDATLGAIAQDRLENDSEEPIPFEAIAAKYDKRKMRK
jgi:hypothetical protein